MPDPVWTQQYDMSQTPEANGFTRILQGAPVVTLTTGGNPANRRVEINSNAGDVSFVTSSVPALDDAVGVTAEMVARSGTPGNAGFECLFLSRALGVRMYASSIIVDLPGSVPGSGVQVTIPTADNAAADVTLRFTYSAGTFRLYRNVVQIGGDLAAPAFVQAFQRVSWWGEEGGTQLVRALRYYIGGPVIPG